MKKGLIFAALACSLMMGVVACNNANNGGQQEGGGGEGGGQETYSVTIQNKENLRKEWRVGDAYRTVTVKIPGVVVQEALSKKELVITSSDANVVSVVGNQATPVGAGTATLTATYKANVQWSDSVEVTVQKGKVYKMVTNPEEGKEYLLAHKEAGGSSKLYSASMEISNNYYIGWETEEENFPVASVTIDATREDAYKYSISLSKTNAEGEKTTKVVSIINTGAGKFAAGFVGESDGKGHNHTEAAHFKIDDQHRLVATCNDSDGTAKDLYFGCSSGYNTTGVGTDANKIVNPTRLYELSAEEIPTTTLTVTPESLTLRPNGVGEIKATVEPFDTTDELTFESSDSEKLLVSANGTVSALEAGTYAVTVKSGAKSVEVPVTVEGEVISLGTREAPLTVDEAVASLNAIGKNHMSPRPMYVQGLVHSVDEKGAWDASYKNASWWLQDDSGAKKFELYRCVCEEGIDGAAVKTGDYVKAYGYGELFGSTFELTTNANGNPASPTMYYCGEAPVVDLEDITVSAISLKVGETKDVDVKPVPAIAELGEVELAWKEATTVAEIVEGQLKVKGLAEGEATLVVSVKDTEISKEVQVTVSDDGSTVDYGTLENPLTPEKARAVIDTVEAGKLTPQKLFVRGVASSNEAVSSGRRVIWLQSTDGATAQYFELYSCKNTAFPELPEGANALVGYTVTATGWGTNYNGTYEFSNKDASGAYDNAEIVAYTAAEVELEDIVVSPTAINIKVGQVQTISVTPDPVNAILPDVELSWKEATSVAQIVEGQLKVEGLAEGEATLVVTAGEISKEVPVTVEEAATGEVADTITSTLTGVPKPGDGEYASYADWSEKSDESNAVYAGNSATTAGEEIQLRWDTSKNKYAGIWSTTSGGHVASVTIVWGETTETASARELLIYGLNTACTGLSDATFKDNAQALGSIKKTDESLTFEIVGSFTHIALRSKSGAMYLESITIVWAD